MERSRKKGTSNLRWRRDMSEFLMAFLVDQAKKGLKVDKTFKKQAFKAAVKAVNERFEVEVSKANIENHLKTIKAKHTTVKRLLSTPGIIFDPDKKQINMNPEALRKHLKMHPNDDIFLNKPIEFFDEMAIICGDDYATGSFAKSITDEINVDVDMLSNENLGPLDDVNGDIIPLTGSDNGGVDPLLENDSRGINPLMDDETGGINHLMDDDTRGTEDYNLGANDVQCTPCGTQLGTSGTPYKDMERRRKRGTPNIRWRRDMSQFLMASLVEQARKGLKIDKIFKKKAYTAAARAVNEKFDAEVSEANVENHLRTIKAKYAAIKRLLDMPGITFDPDLKQINMDPEELKRHLKTYPNDDPFLNKPIEFFDEMAIICGEAQVTGQHGKSIRDEVRVGAEIAFQDNAGPSMDDDNIGVNDVESTQLRDRQNPDQSVSTSTEKTPSSRKRTRDSEVQVLRDIASNICELVSAIKSSLSKDFANELYAEVMKCEGFEEEGLGMAFDYLMENEMRARSFLAKSKSLRQSWMSRYLQGSRQ